MARAAGAARAARAGVTMCRVRHRPNPRHWPAGRSAPRQAPQDGSGQGSAGLTEELSRRLAPRASGMHRTGGTPALTVPRLS